MTFVIGENVGPYRITDRLGQGGMATVYRAYHAKLDRYVAIKVLHPAFKEDPDFLSRFEREAQIVARLEHPNIVPIYDYSDHNGQPYLVMKFIEGATLKARISTKPLSIQDVVTMMTAVGYALSYAHSMGILHRDIKPSNILLERHDEPYLADFGLARIAGAGESTMSQDMMLGTPQYMSPEQAQGVRDLDAATDIYSLGVIIYELLVGRVPFNADTPYAIVHDHIYTPLPLPSLINPQIPRAVEQVLLKGLAKERTDRYPSAAEMVDAFKQAVEESHMIDAGFTVGNFRVGTAASAPPKTLSTPTTTSGAVNVGSAGTGSTPLMPGTATQILPDRTPATTPLPLGVPGVLPSSMAAALSLPQSLTELRMRQHRRKRQAQLWVLFGFAGFVVTILTGMIVAVSAINDPSIRDSLFVAPVGPVGPPPGGTPRGNFAPPPGSPPPFTAAATTTPKARPATVTSAATSAAATSLSTASLDVLTIPARTEAEALAHTQSDSTDPINWFALALAQAKPHKFMSQNLPAFQKALTLAADNEPLLIAAAQAFDTNRLPGFAAYLYARILTLTDVSAADRAAADHYLYGLVRQPTPTDIAIFKTLLTDYATVPDVLAMASIASSRYGNLTDAETLLKQAVALAPGDWTVHLARGILQLAQNQTDLAIGEFRAVQGTNAAPGWASKEAAQLVLAAAATATAAASEAATANVTAASTSTVTPTLTPTGS